FFALPALFSLFLFVSTLRLPLASTLFPYTTLFRSAALGRPPLPADRGSLDGRRRRPLRARLGAALARSRAAVRGTAAARGGPALPPGQLRRGEVGPVREGGRLPGRPPRLRRRLRGLHPRGR